jgi:hypothetical protein
MSNSIENLSRLITSDTSGVIWLTDTPLANDLDGVYEFNYLTNGLLTKSIQNQQSDKDSNNFFITENFGASFFLSHLLCGQSSDTKADFKEVYNQIEMAKPIFKDNGRIIYVYNKSSKIDGIKLLKELSKRYSEIEFIQLTL